MEAVAKSDREERQAEEGEEGKCQDVLWTAKPEHVG